MSLVELVKKSTPRNNPYWEILEYCRHIGIQKLDRRNGYWVARIRRKDGRYKQRRLMPWRADSDSYNEAVASARKWFGTPGISAIASDPFPKGSNQGLVICPWGDTFTVGHALEDYLKWKRISATKSHYDSVVSLINHHLVTRLSHLALDELNGRHIAEFSLDVLETPPKRGNQPQGPRRLLENLLPEELRKRKKTLNALIGILRLAVKLAWENGETESERSWRCIRRVPNVDAPRNLFLTRPECNRLLSCCRDDLKKLVQGALYTGCRIAELANLTVRDVASHVFGIYVAPSKSRRPRYVFLPDEGMAFFLSLCVNRDQDDYVFSHQSGFSWQGRHKHLFKSAVREAGLPNEFVFHGLRHTYASQLVQSGTPLIVIAQQLGHANTDTVSRTYGHLAPQIREIQVRLHFAELDTTFAAQARELSSDLEALSRSLQGEDWRDYALIAATHNWPNSNFVQNASEIVERLLMKERPN